MKTTLLICFTFLTTIHVYSQNQTKVEGQSKAEQFSEITGALIQKTVIEIGNMKNVQMKVWNYRDLTSSDTLKSLRLEYKSTDKYSTSPKIASLDSDEISDLLKAMQLIKNEIIISNPENYTEVTYKSQGGLEAGCFFSKQKWSPYLKLKKGDDKSYVFLETEDLETFIALLKKTLSTFN